MLFKTIAQDLNNIVPHQKHHCTKNTFLY